MLRNLIAVFLILSATTSAIASSPSEIKKPPSVDSGKGVVRISLRSQVQYTAPLYIWFQKIEDGKPISDQAISFSRSEGVPLAGSNLIDSRPRYYSVAPGRYRLAAHIMRCEGLPPPGTVCMAYGKPVPTGRYDDSFVEFEVVSGKLTDAGEFVLELPPNIDVGGKVSFSEAYREMNSAQIRWRKISALLSPQFSQMAVADFPIVPDSLKSNISCENKPKGMEMFYPFTC